MKNIVLRAVALFSLLEVLISLTTTDYLLLSKRIRLLPSPIGSIAFFSPVLKYYSTLHILSLVMSAISLILIGKTIKSMFRGEDNTSHIYLFFISVIYTTAVSLLAEAMHANTPLFISIIFILFALVAILITTTVLLSYALSAISNNTKLAYK